MTRSVRSFYDQIKSCIKKDSDLPGFFAYYLIVLRGTDAATVTTVRKCYEDCDLHPPSWLGSHFSNGLRSKPRRYIRTKNGYRLENALRESIQAQVSATSPQSLVDQSMGLLSGIQYHGIAGGSQDCLDAVARLIQCGDEIHSARVLTANNRHSLLLSVNSGDPVLIRSGFSSGYIGEGPRAFSRALQLLSAHGTKIDEMNISEAMLDRLDVGLPAFEDEMQIQSTRANGSHWQTYLLDKDLERFQSGSIWDGLPCAIPFAVIDSRIFDLAKAFWSAPDDRILKGYRRLEDLIRHRTGLTEHGAKLFSQAFTGKGAKLTWTISDEGEKIGRANLFTASFMAHRNPRAHRELQVEGTSQLSEFLLLNHLYKLEREAVDA